MNYFELTYIKTTSSLNTVGKLLDCTITYMVLVYADGHKNRVCGHRHVRYILPILTKSEQEV